MPHLPARKESAACFRLACTSSASGTNPLAESAALVRRLHVPYPERVLCAVGGGHERGFCADFHRRAGIVIPNLLPFQPVSFASNGGPKISKPINAEATAPNKTDA